MRRCKLTPVERVREIVPALVAEIRRLHQERAALRALLAPVMGVAPEELEDWADDDLLAYADLLQQKFGTFVL